MRLSCLHFNSIKVRLEQASAKNGSKGKANFNSIKVRLEHEAELGEVRA